MRGSDYARFLAKTRERDGHLIWTAGSLFRFADGRRISPTAAMWELRFGSRGEDRGAMRTCEVEDCVLHVGLFRQREILDMGREKAKRLPPERRGRTARLTPALVRAIRKMPTLSNSRGPRRRGEYSRKEIAKMFGVSFHTVQAIRNGAIWRWVS